MCFLADVQYNGRMVVLLPLILIVALVWGCSSESDGRSPVRRAVPVMVGSVSQKAVPVQLGAIGNVQASLTVAVRSLVGGEVVGVHFTEGQDVQKGRLLFTIDPRSYEAAVRQAEANLARDLAQVKQAEAAIAKDTAQAEYARVQAERYKSLVDRQLVARDQYEQYRTNADALEATLLAGRAALENAKATVQADRAVLENARIQLGYCSIRSPVAGRTGNLLVHRGNIVRANDTIPLAVVNEIHPVHVSFTLPEKNLPVIRKHMVNGKLQVQAYIPNDDKNPELGLLTFVDNAIDPTTGTIQFKATFSNKTERLWPGQFVNVVLVLATQPDAVVVPTKALQTGQQGRYVFVVKKDLTVESRIVTVDRVVNDETIIARGVSPGETVVIDGQLQLVPGTKVEIKTTAPNGMGGRKPA